MLGTHPAAALAKLAGRMGIDPPVQRTLLSTVAIIVTFYLGIGWHRAGLNVPNDRGLERAAGQRDRRMFSDCRHAKTGVCCLLAGMPV